MAGGSRRPGSDASGDHGVQTCPNALLLAYAAVTAELLDNSLMVSLSIVRGHEFKVTGRMCAVIETHGTTVQLEESYSRLISTLPFSVSMDSAERSLRAGRSNRGNCP